jgi:NAD(P)-dependent dehydrogenase (short-subunit alcohol dehydrogenase family)
MTKTWLVTGSSRGLGRTLVEAILASGDRVAATARKAEHLNDLTAQYGTDKLLTLSLDVTNVEQVQQVVNEVKQTFGRIDVVVNNAGYADVASIEDMTLDSFRTQFETNFFGVVNVTKAVLPTLRAQGSGHIMQVSSVGGRTGSPGLGSYQSAKWAVGGFSTVLSREVAPLGIKVTVLEPGGMKTDWAGSSMGTGLISEPYRDSVGKFSALRQKMSENWTEPGSMAEAIVYIANVAEPPLRLLLGPETPDIAAREAKAVAQSDEKWRDVTVLKQWLP